MTGEAQVETQDPSVPTADDAASQHQEAPQAPPGDQDGAAAHSPGGKDAQGKPQPKPKEEPSAEEALLEKLTADPPPAEEEEPLVDEQEDPDRLLSLTELERQALSERNRKRFDKLTGMLRERRKHAEESEPLVELGRKVRAQLGDTGLSDEELQGSLALALAQKSDPRKAYDEVMRVARELAQEHGFAEEQPQAEEQAKPEEKAPSPVPLTPFEGELPEELADAVSLGLLNEQTARWGLAAQKAADAAEAARQALPEQDGKKPEAADKARDEEQGQEKGQEGEQSPPVSFDDALAGQAIAANLQVLSGSQDMQAVEALFDELLPIMSEIIDASGDQFPQGRVPPAMKPALVTQAYGIHRQRQAVSAERPPSPGTGKEHEPIHQGGGPPPQIKDRPLPDEYSDQACETFKKLTSPVKGE